MAPRTRRIAVLSDVHGNSVALEAVLAELEDENADLVVFCGDLTWGPLPARDAGASRRPHAPALYVRGNAERALLEPDDEPTERERWLATAHPTEALALLATFAASVSVDIDGLGPVRFCHGSPRSDEELVTPETPAERMRELSAGIEERTLVTAHTHLQFDRRVAGLRSVNPGSVGMPYAERPGAYWALLGPDVELRRTEYPIEAAVAPLPGERRPARRADGRDPGAAADAREVIAHAESLRFSG